MKRCTPGQFDLRHFESEPTVRGRVLKRWDVGRVLRGPWHITSGRPRGLMMDETGDYACGNHHARCAPPFVALSRARARAHVCARVREVGHGRVRVSVLSRGTSRSAGGARGGEGDGDEFREGFRSALR